MEQSIGGNVTEEKHKPATSSSSQQLPSDKHDISKPSSTVNERKEQKEVSEKPKEPDTKTSKSVTQSSDSMVIAATSKDTMPVSLTSEKALTQVS